MLTHRQKEVFDFIALCIEITGSSPSYREISVAMCRDVSAVWHTVNQIIERGHLVKRKGEPNGLYIPTKRRYFAPTADGWPWVQGDALNLPSPLSPFRKPT